MQKNNPIIINVPHSSTIIPSEELKYFTTKNLQHELDVMTDHFCDDLFDTGERMIRFPISRLVCDPERFRDDSKEIMASIGMGAIYTRCSDGAELKSISPAHKEKLLERYYDRYHMELENAVQSALDRFDKCLIIDGHSFYDEPLPYELNQDKNRPDICIGTDENHTPKETEHILKQFFTERGYTVEINRPFAGSLVPLKYYRKDKRVMSVMIEVNRRLYIDHEIRKKDGYFRVKSDIAEILSKI
ncbi:MAG: N-formylglutamate amidohydrolase [Lachnospiraceae bacterium]|nr:N-formylglutamate amidohydrolase [Lachnospiraceae bacterium]